MLEKATGVIFFLLFFVFFSTSTYALPSHIMNKLEKGEKIILANVDHFDLKNNSSSQQQKQLKQQKLNFQSMALHPNSCSIALQKLSKYEQYDQFLDFIKESSYNDETQNLHLKLDSSLLPFPLLLQFKMPRISKVGLFSFEFPIGIFPGLAGTIDISEYKKKCLFTLKAEWQGNDTGIPNTIIEIFSQTLVGIAIEKLFRLSSF